MTTVECRLCLADIPHGYDHSLEIPQARDAANEPFFKPVLPNVPPAVPSPKQGPDITAIAYAFYSIFITGASLFISWLIILAAYLDAVAACDTCDGKGWAFGLFGLSIAGMLLNWVFALATRKEIKCWIIELGFWIGGGFWGGVLIWMKLKL